MPSKTSSPKLGLVRDAWAVQPVTCILVLAGIARSYVMAYPKMALATSRIVPPLSRMSEATSFEVLGFPGSPAVDGMPDEDSDVAAARFCGIAACFVL